MAKVEYDQGYADAIEAIKQALQGKSGGPGDQQSNSSNQSDGRDMDLSDTPAGEAMKNAGGNPQQAPDPSQGSGKSGSQSRGNGDQGQVTEADCAGQYTQGVPDQPGGFIDPSEGNKLAQEEGYSPSPTSQDSISNQWKDLAVRAAEKMKGSGAGAFQSKIFGLWKSTKDWKKEFKKIIGRSLNTQDKRSAFANKNVLASQGRVARTDKDKYDAVDFISIFTDSSGSITDKDLKFMLSEIYAIAQALKPERLLCGQFDTKIQWKEDFSSLAEFKKYAANATVKGRGGTECKCIWDLLENDPKYKRINNELCIIVTDGYLTQYKRNPRRMNNLCWVILDNPGWNLEQPDTHTTVIHLNSKDIKA